MKIVKVLLGLSLVSWSAFGNFEYDRYPNPDRIPSRARLKVQRIPVERVLAKKNAHYFNLRTYGYFVREVRVFWHDRLGDGANSIASVALDGRNLGTREIHKAGSIDSFPVNNYSYGE